MTEPQVLQLFSKISDSASEKVMALPEPELKTQGTTPFSALSTFQLSQLGLNLPASIMFRGRKFVTPHQEQDSSHHVTIINKKLGVKIKAALDQLSAKDKIIKIEQIKELLSSANLKVKLTQQVYFLERDIIRESGPENRVSLIIMLNVAGLAELYKKFNQLGVDVGEPHPAHLSLYIGEGQKYGIGLDSKAQFEAAIAAGKSGATQGLRAIPILF
ncbi:MAG: hypothetical protein R3A13_11480 [Bdellovibrionota bacterium]